MSISIGRRGILNHFRFYSTSIRSAPASPYEQTHPRVPSRYGWRYHMDNTFQFILWASFGSAALHLLNIKQKYADKERRLSTKIAILKDIIKRVGDGETVDVEKELKIGKTEEERDWEDVINAFREDAGIPSVRQSQLSVNSETMNARPLATNANTTDTGDTRLPTVSRGWFWSS